MQPNEKSMQIKWYYWIFPLAAICITAWLGFQYWTENGLKVRISFDDASSIQVEKTKVKFRGVEIGTVSKITIADDQKDVWVEVTLRREYENYAVEGTKFWLVTPKVGLQGISGLDTIFEGTYIAIQPGPSDKTAKTDFKAQLSQGAVDPLEDTIGYWVETASAESLNPGDAVTYRGVKVGSITKVVLAKTAREALIKINIENRYHKFIREGTVFWRKAGVHAQLGLFHSELKINSLDTIMNGGIEMALVDQPGKIVAVGTKFPLHEDPPKDYEKWAPQSLD